MKPFNHYDGQILSVENAKIYYEETGNPNKDVLVLLHGGFGNIEDFNPLIAKLEKEFRIIGIDSRGQGKSTLGNESLTYELLQNDVEKILNHLKIDTLNIIGFSDGGIIAYRLATFSDFKIKKLITIGSRWHRNNVTETKEILSAVDAKKWREKFPDMVSTYETLNSQPDFDKLLAVVVDMWLNEESYPNENVINIKADTLIIRGDKDHLIRRNFVFDIAGLIKDSNLSNIPFAGHAVHVDQPELLTMTINKFMNK